MGRNTKTRGTDRVLARPGRELEKRRRIENARVETRIIAALEIRNMAIADLVKNLDIDKYEVEKAIIRMHRRHKKEICIASWVHQQGGYAAVYGLGSRADKPKPDPASYTHPANRLSAETICTLRMLDLVHRTGVLATRGLS